ncbi:syntaxin-6-like isoform X2 [Leptotrombidium deliense]|uniref:Syntaxin-6-like isoform X2 n=1 Tax=Leptotrombidium deliense TaxID=299467 RepID=A0A443SEB2_9ACAR|nr:syntaxin-6-like isoform X2 [Leptotrombidium deliense]
MAFDDPFFTVKDEVLSTLIKARTQYERWIELKEESNNNSGLREEFEWTTTELRNALRSIEWDLEDLEETVGMQLVFKHFAIVVELDFRWQFVHLLLRCIFTSFSFSIFIDSNSDRIVESNPKKFKLNENEIVTRKTFITKTKEEVAKMQDKLADFKSTKRTMSTIISNPTLNFGNAVSAATNSTSGGAKYTRLQNEMESPHRNIAVDSAINMETRNDLSRHEKEINESVNHLKTISDRINREIDEQAVMLEDVGHVSVVDSRFDSTLRKVAKVLHITNDRRQWTVLGVLSTVVLIVVFVTIF